MTIQDQIAMADLRDLVEGYMDLADEFEHQLAVKSYELFEAQLLIRRQGEKIDRLHNLLSKLEGELIERDREDDYA